MSWQEMLLTVTISVAYGAATGMAGISATRATYWIGYAFLAVSYVAGRLGR